jgi:hypothetical protein
MILPSISADGESGRSENLAHDERDQRVWLVAEGDRILAIVNARELS